MLYIILKGVFRSIELCYSLTFSISSFIFLQSFRLHGKNSNPHDFFVLGRKAAETARNINDAFGPGITNKRVTQRWFKKFRNGDKSLKDDHQTVTITFFGAISAFLWSFSDIQPLCERRKLS